MSENDADETQEATDQASSWSSQADALFKELTREEAVALGLQPVETEFQHTTTLRADLVLSVPLGLNLEGTMFDFFRTINVLEFKSQNDRFTLREFAKNDLRTDLQFLQGKYDNYEKILNIIVTSRYPKRFLEYAKQRGIVFKSDSEKAWLWQAQVGFQNVAIVVCKDLPLEDRYVDWLFFVPSDNPKWKIYVNQLVERNDERRLGLIEKMRPKEFAMAIQNKTYEELLAKGVISQEYLDMLNQERLEAIQMLLKDMIEYQSKRLGQALAGLPLEARLAGLTPEERHELFKQELAKLSPEERLELLKQQSEKPK